MLAIFRIKTTVATWIVAASLGLAATGGSPPPADSDERIPLARVKGEVRKYFDSLPSFHDGDLITRDRVEPLFAHLESLGWEPTDRGQIIGLLVSAREPLARNLLGDKKGRAFMRAIAAMPGAYDRLDRLSRMPHGEQTIVDMIHKKGGPELIRYMTGSKGGTELGRQMARAPAGHDFNKPTGRIYTLSQLLARLEQSYHSPKADTAGHDEARSDAPESLRLPNAAD